jgi:serine/threonine protein kinase
VLEAGTIVAGYRIDGVIDAGGMGTVYRATEVLLDRVVALKLLAPDLSEDPGFRARLERRANLQAALAHPNIVPIFGFGQSEYGMVVAMRLIEGPTLKDLILARELDPRRSLRILTQVAQAIDDAHDAGLVHVDISPQKILVAAGDHAYIADFGVVRTPVEPGTVTATGRPMGMLDYIAPEQVMGEPAGAASDSYAFTAVLYECLTGEVPFARRGTIARLHAHMTEPPPSVTERRPDLPAAIDDVIARGMAKDPASRPGSATELSRSATSALAAWRPVAGLSPGSGQVSFEPERANDLGAAALATLIGRAATLGIVPEVAPRAPGPTLPQLTPVDPSPASIGKFSELDERAPATEAGARVRAAPRAPPYRSVGSVAPWLSWLLAGGVVLALIKWITGFPLASAVGTEVSNTTAEDVECTVFSHASVRRSEPFLVQVFAHRPQDARYATARASEADPGTRKRVFKNLSCSVPIGTVISFELRMRDAIIESPVASIVWRGHPEGAQFEVVVKDPNVQSLIGTVAIAVDARPIGHVKFRVTVAPARPAELEPVGDDAREYTRAFVSYARKDRDKVIERLQLAPMFRLRYYQDLLHLQPGEVWSRELERAIDGCDVFLLFWSSYAKQSREVRKEVRRALERKAGADELPPEIFPVILEGPPIVKPWMELAHLQFDDALRYFIGRPT